jgi:hypothetical protein
MPGPSETSFADDPRNEWDNPRAVNLRPEQQVNITEDCVALATEPRRVCRSIL